MKKQLLFMLICFGLIIQGNGSFSAVYAQARMNRISAKQITPKQKGSTEVKKASVQAIVRAKKSNTNQIGDPCLEAAPISIGQTINGALAGTDCILEDGTIIDFYTFNGTTGQAISISQSSAEFDSYLYLLDDAGNIIDENDDSDGLDSRIPIEGGVVTLPYTGEFIIGVNQYEPATGAYTLSLNTDAACAPQPITYNQTVNGTLASTDCAVNLGGEAFYTDIYTFNGVAGQQISITQNSTAVDSYLVFHTPSGDGSDEDDNSGGGSDARIPTAGTFTLTESGTYAIEASSFNSFETGAYTITVAGPTVAAPNKPDFDYDGDGKTDLSVYRGQNWFILNSSNNTLTVKYYGLATDTIVPADYDGDGKTDIVVYRPNQRAWYGVRSSDNSNIYEFFSAAGDLPVPADYDGDGKADIAVFRPASGEWFRLNSSNGQLVAVTFGTSGDKPVIGDFDGDGKADITVYRPATGSWYSLRSSDGQFTAVNFGVSSDKLVPADYDGDGKTDIAVFRPSDGFWYRLNSSNNQFVAVNFGVASDIPVAADYDGDNKTDIAVFRASTGTWYQLLSTTGFASQTFGQNGDFPTPNAFVR